MRQLPISNFRSVSGYRNKDGLAMKPGRIFRGASLDRLSMEDAVYMKQELGIRYILDYRDAKEAELKKDVLADGMVYERISALIVSSGQQGFDFGELLQQNLSAAHVQMLFSYLLDGYQHMPFHNPAYHRLFELLQKNDGNIYFHCSAGKDRTGIGAFLIMMALGMREEDGVKEYLLSNQYLKDFAAGFYREHPMSEEDKIYSDKLLYVAEESLMTSIKAIKGRYGSYEEFFEREYGIGAEKRAVLRSIYCE